MSEPTHIPSPSSDIIGIPDHEISDNQFLQTISQLTFQKWYASVTLVVEDFSTNVLALIDSGGNTNFIKEGIIPTKYCACTKENLYSANGEPLNIKYKLNKGYIQNDDYCFKNVFLIVSNISNQFILGTPFSTQIYPFSFNEFEVHTQIMGKPISFKFLTKAKQREVLLLQTSSIYKQINTLQIKQNQILPLQEEMSYLRVEEQLKNPSTQ